MATGLKRPLVAFNSSNPYGSLYERDLAEGASQTFPVGAPLKISSGLLIEWVNPTDADIHSFSLTEGHNDTGSTVKVVMAFPDVEIEANFLGSAAADNVLAAADCGLTRDLAKGTDLLGTGEDGWYIADTSGDVAVIISQFRSNQVLPNQLNSFAQVGDTNARVFAKIIAGKSLWT